MKKKLFLLSLIALFGLAACTAPETESSSTPPATETAAAATVEPKKEETKPEAKEDNVPREHKAALKKAEDYAELMDMSKAAVYDQLTSDVGEGFDKEAAQYAIDNIKHDWKVSALNKAKSYAETMNMSDSAIYDQLTSEYGEKFTAEEAQYAIDNLE